MKSVMQARYYQVCSNHDPGLTLTYFTAKVKGQGHSMTLVQGHSDSIFKNLHLWNEEADELETWYAA